MSQDAYEAKSNLNVGDKVDKYEIIERLGAGGMSVVWKGYDALLDRTVAVKELRIDGEDDDALRERFRREAKIQKSLASGDERLIELIDFIEEDRGLFIVMEYVEGPSLEQLLQDNAGPLDERQALGIVAGTARALQYLHNEGVVHRDLKPSNILLPLDGGIRICDFGLATLLEDQEQMSSGSVRYMAPELFTGENVDGRADLYALGIIAYEVLAGREKFEQAFRLVLRDQRNQALRWMKWHTNPRASAPPLNELNPDIDRTLSDLIGRLMEKDRTVRINSAEELIEAIRLHFSSTGKKQAAARAADLEAAKQRAAASTEAVAEQATATLPKRSKLPLYLGGFLVLNLLILLAVFFYYDSQQRQEIRQQRLAARDVYDAAREAEREENWAEAMEMYDELGQEWPDEQVGIVSRIRSFYCQAQIASARDQYDKAETYYERMQDLEQRYDIRIYKPDLIRQQRRDLLAERSFRQVIDRIADWIDEGEFNRAQREIDELLATHPSEQERAVIATLTGRIERGRTSAHETEALAEIRKLEEAGNLDEAIALADEALRIESTEGVREARQQLIRKKEFRETVQRGRQRENQGRLADAIAEYNRALNIMDDTKLERRVQSLQAREAVARGRSAETLEDYAAASRAYQQALKIIPDHEQARAGMDRVRENLEREDLVKDGDRAMAQGDYAGAMRQYEKALEMGASPTVANKKLQAEIRLLIAEGDQHLARREVDEAIESFNEAESRGADPGQIAGRLEKAETLAEFFSSRDAAKAAFDRGEFVEAKKLVNQALQIGQAEAIASLVDLQALNEFKSTVEFEDMLAKARNDIANENWISARAWLLTAQKIRDTERIREYLDKVAGHLPPLPGTATADEDDEG